MFGPGRAFDKCPGRAGRPGSLGVADFTQGRGSRGAGRRPPATLPSLRAATRTLGKRDRGGAWRLAGSGAASGAADRTVRVWARPIDSARATRRVMQPRALGSAVHFWDSLSQAAGSRGSAWLEPNIHATARWAAPLMRAALYSRDPKNQKICKLEPGPPCFLDRSCFSSTRGVENPSARDRADFF